MDVDKQQKCGEHQKLVGKMQLGMPASGWSNKMEVVTETQFVRFGPPQLQQDSSTSRIPPPVPPKPDLPPQPHIPPQLPNPDVPPSPQPEQPPDPKY